MSHRWRVPVWLLLVGLLCSLAGSRPGGLLTPVVAAESSEQLAFVRQLSATLSSDARVKLYARAREMAPEDLVSILRRMGERTSPVEAQRLNQLAVEMSKATESNYGLARALEWRGVLLTARGEYLAAVADFERAVKLFNEIGDAGGKGWALHNMAKALTAAGQPFKAVEKLNQSVAAFAPEDFEGRGWAFDDLGALHLKSKHLDLAEKAYKESLDHFRKAKHRSGQAWQTYNLAQVANQSGNFRVACERYGAATGLFRLERNASGIGRCQDELGNILYLRGDYPRAMQAYHQSRDAFAMLGKEGKDGQAWGLFNLGRVHRMQGELDEADVLYKRALAQFRDTRNPGGQWRCWEAIAHLNFFRGDYGSLILAYFESRRVQQQSPEHTNSASVYLDQGMFACLNGRYAEAIASLTKAKEGLMAPDRWAERGLIASVTALALEGEARQGAPAPRALLLRALALYRESYQIFKSRNPAGESWAQIGIGQVCQQLGRYDEAIDAQNKAVSRLQQIGNRGLEAWARANLGQSFQSKGRNTEALEQFRTSAKLAQRCGAPDVLIRCYAGTGRCYELAGRLRSASAEYRKATALIDQVRGGAVVDPLKIQIRESYADVYDGLVRCSLARAQRNDAMVPEEATLGRNLVEVAFSYAEAARSRALLEMLAERRVKVTAGISPQLLAAESILLRKAAAAATRLRDSQNDPRTSPAQLRTLHAESLACEDTLAAWSVKNKATRYAALRYPRSQRLVETQRMLPPLTTMLAYYVMPKSTVVWVISRSNASHFVLGVGSHQLDSDVRLFLQPMQRLKSGSILFEEPTEVAVRFELYRRLVAPVRARLQGAKRLVVVPHRSLCYLPFSALATSPECDKSVERFLIEAYAVVVIPSASVMQELRAASPLPAKKDIWAAIGFAPFAPGDSASAKAQTEAAPEARIAEASATAPSIDRSEEVEKSVLRAAAATFPVLARSGAEVKGICAGFNSRGKALVREEATESQAKAWIEASRFVHFATHGILDDRNPQHSGVVLWEARAAHKSQTAEDGILETQEVFNLRLQAQLVVLSACETALGSKRALQSPNHGEGFLGLTRAFLYAGTPSVVVSLWKVEDRSTERLMIQFYQGLHPSSVLDKAEALRRAQLAVMSQRRRRAPFYWAAFSLIGDWR